MSFTHSSLPPSPLFLAHNGGNESKLQSQERPEQPLRAAQDGAVTVTLAPPFHRVVQTEVSVSAASGFHKCWSAADFFVFMQLDFSETVPSRNSSSALVQTFY